MGRDLRGLGDAAQQIRQHFLELQERVTPAGGRRTRGRTPAPGGRRECCRCWGVSPMGEGMAGCSVTGGRTTKESVGKKVSSVLQLQKQSFNI